MKLLLWPLLAYFSVASSVPIEGKRFLLRCTLRKEEDVKFIEHMVDQEQLDVWDHQIYTKGESSTVTMLANSKQISSINAHLKCEKGIDIEVIEHQILHSKGDPDVESGFFGDYQSYDQIQKQLALYKSRSNLNVQMQNLGSTYEGRSISAIRFSNMAKEGDRKQQQLLFSCGQHAREWIASASCMYLIDNLFLNYEKDPRITKMLNNFEVIIIPLVNPDGYEYSRNSDRYWRKNKRNNGRNTRAGVDLNRNWPNRWGSIGISTNPRSDIYCGPSAGSEPEVASIINFINSLTGLAAGVDVHSYGELIMRSFGWTTRLSKDESSLKAIGDIIAANINGVKQERYVSQRSGELYPTGGSMDDWMYEQRHIIGLTFELRDKGGYGFLLPPSQIVPTGMELVEGALTLSENVQLFYNTKRDQDLTKGEE